MHTVCSFSTTIKVAAMTSEVLKRTINIDVPKDEILIIFHTANALLREIRSGGIDLTVKQATKYKTQSRILVPVDDTVTDLVQKLDLSFLM